MYDETETRDWLRMVGLAVCGAPVLTGTREDYACQLPPDHDGPHDPR